MVNYDVLILCMYPYRYHLGLQVHLWKGFSSYSKWTLGTYLWSCLLPLAVLWLTQNSFWMKCNWRVSAREVHDARWQRVFRLWVLDQSCAKHTVWTADPKHHQLCSADLSVPGAVVCYRRSWGTWAEHWSAVHPGNMPCKILVQAAVNVNQHHTSCLRFSLHSVVWKNGPEVIFRTFSLTS